MKKQLVILAASALIAFPGLSPAAQFSIVGPRALGMGGASVAAVNDSTAVYWNPAALADYRKVDIRIPAGASIQDHMGLQDKWDRINDIYGLVQLWDLTAAAEMRSLLNDLDKPKTGVDVDASAGLLISIPVAKSAIAVSALGFGYAGLFPTIDTLHTETTLTTTNFIANNNSAITGIGMGVSEPAVSFATSLGDKVFIGVNAKMISAETYVTTQILTSNNFDNFIDDLQNSKTKSSKASLDAGILIAPAESFRIGVVGRNLNSPSFPLEGVIAYKQPSGDVGTSLDSNEIELESQYRAGIAWKPFKTLTLAADYDLTRNKTFVRDYENQTAAVGLEKTFLSECLNLRVGANKNLADSNAKNVYTAGFGVRLLALQLDVAGAYDFDARQAGVSADLALRF